MLIFGRENPQIFNFTIQKFGIFIFISNFNKKDPGVHVWVFPPKELGTNWKFYFFLV
jgi:hypothetical protein